MSLANKEVVFIIVVIDVNEIFRVNFYLRELQRLYIN